MAKRKLEQLTPENRREKAFNKEEMMIESVHLILQYNLLKGKASNDTTLIQYANKLNVEELRSFNTKMKEKLNI